MGNRWSMGKYSCPICSEDVSPVSSKRILGGGTIVPSADGGLPIELKRCSKCGASLERTALDPWYTAGSLASARQFATADFL
jgi:hypothetical protein